MKRFVVEQALGKGGMGEVFRGRVVGLAGFSRPVALKRVASTWAGDGLAADMLEREARISARLSHPNIVAVHDFDRDDGGQVWLTMELVDGPDLGRLAERARLAGRPLDVAQVAWIAGEVLRALDHAHRQGIVHRDVSPQNVLVSRAGAIKLSDFGIAKVISTAHSGTVRGKVAYLSPEQAAGLPIDARTDLFSLGVVLYELLAGTRPFGGQTEPEVIASILRGQVHPLETVAPWVPLDLATLTMRLLAHEREARFASAGETLSALFGCACYPLDGMTPLAEAVALLAPESPPGPPSAAAALVTTPIGRRTHAADTPALDERTPTDRPGRADARTVEPSRRWRRALTLALALALGAAIGALATPRVGVSRAAPAPVAPARTVK
jgi:eukaryotic-like serine/threonine-protein kinase